MIAITAHSHCPFHAPEGGGGGGGGEDAQFPPTYSLWQAKVNPLGLEREELTTIIDKSQSRSMRDRRVIQLDVPRYNG